MLVTASDDDEVASALEDDERDPEIREAEPADAFNFMLAVIDDNVLLGVPFKLMPTPTVFQRAMLLVLFVATCVFMQLAEEILGPICIREYTRQCPDFLVTLNKDPPEVLNMTAATLEDQARRLDDAALGESEDAVRAEDIMDSDRDSLYAQYRAVLSRSVTRPILERSVSHLAANCSRPMCDLFAPDMVTKNYTRRYDKARFWIDGSLGPVPVANDGASEERGTVVVAGVCKCTPNEMYESVLGADQMGVWRSVVFMLFVTTAVPKVFRKVFEIEHSGIRGWSCAECTASHVVKLMTLLLVAIVMFECSVCIIVGDRITLKNGLRRALFNALLFQPLVSIVLPIFWQRCCCYCPDCMNPPWVNPSYRGSYYDIEYSVEEDSDYEPVEDGEDDEKG